VGSMARLAHHCSAGFSPVRVGFASDRAVITPLRVQTLSAFGRQVLSGSIWCCPLLC
jgi:hypothetical protein